MAPERLLQRVQRAVGPREPFDGADVGALGLDREHEARPYRLVVEQQALPLDYGTVVRLESGNGLPVASD